MHKDTATQLLQHGTLQRTRRLPWWEREQIFGLLMLMLASVLGFGIGLGTGWLLWG